MRLSPERLGEPKRQGGFLGHGKSNTGERFVTVRIKGSDGRRNVLLRYDGGIDFARLHVW